jgi:hypothetical protein
MATIKVRIMVFLGKRDNDRRGHRELLGADECPFTTKTTF